MNQQLVGTERNILLIELDTPFQSPGGAMHYVALLPECSQTYMMAEDIEHMLIYIREWEEDSGITWIQPDDPAEKKFKFHRYDGLWSNATTLA